MAAVKDIVYKMKDVEKTVNGYFFYDVDVDGLVSSGINSLSEARKLLEDLTKENITKALKTIQDLKEQIDPFYYLLYSAPYNGSGKIIARGIKHSLT